MINICAQGAVAISITACAACNKRPAIVGYLLLVMHLSATSILTMALAGTPNISLSHELVSVDLD